MARKDEEIFKIREFLGVDLNVNARVSAPGSWALLENLWMKHEGELRQRPGSVEFCNEVTMPEGEPVLDPQGQPDDFTWHQRRGAYLEPSNHQLTSSDARTTDTVPGPATREISPIQSVVVGKKIVQVSTITTDTTIYKTRFT